ncbi:hypothetical protein [Azospirillum brasilense]|uniref:hypothetical protein n=1 Tax=Azospirillum brasilense TaxID=192 RepID=UPI0011C4532F|nr:hypothetical protein [Azospirillum brasilense]NUB25889.1 hypothetical protein [Azospirillum brasilense]NUB31296.1 hypothetical protein [Azospirillum brasilense]
MGDGITLRFAVRASDLLVRQMAEIEGTYPQLKGFLNAIIATYDNLIEGRPGERKVAKYRPRQKAGPNEPLHTFNTIAVFLRFEKAVAYIEGLWFVDNDVALGVARDVKRARQAATQNSN